MITFIICLTLLVTAYFTYGKYLERIAGIDGNRLTPCHTKADGVDYILMPRWKVFLIQLLNIAGTGPIFGAILGACFGPVAFIWITLGGIFFGSMHDFLSGIMIVRDNGRSLPEVIGKWLGPTAKHFMRYFSIILLILVGTVFILSPAQLLGTLVPAIAPNAWLWIILGYYLLATLLPIDKIIGKLYPLFGLALLIMALGLLGVILFGKWSVPELTSLHNYQLTPQALPIIPTLFITIACGAISGFHATQSPMMARCVGNEKECRSVFYGSMITESIIALIWAAVAMAFFSGPTGLAEALSAHDNNAAWAVDIISQSTLGRFGAILALLGVVAAPITSGDTAFRSARLIIADLAKLNQTSITTRILVSLPLFVAGYAISQIDFAIVWRYFAWTNQAIAAIVLWAIFVWLRYRNANKWIAFIPAVIMTYVVSTFVFISTQFIGMGPQPLAYTFGAIATLTISVLMLNFKTTGTENT